MKYAAVLLCIGIISFYLFGRRSGHTSAIVSKDEAEQTDISPPQTREKPAAPKQPAPQLPATPQPPLPVSARDVTKAQPAPKSADARTPDNTHAFAVEDGVATIDKDIVLGKAPEGKTEGIAQLPELQLWPSHEIPYYIQPSLQNHDRVQEAIKLFENTAVTFVPYTDQEDVLVFEEGTGTCKSYVGRIGGKQPIWISPKCGGYEIAHEMMHALGFLHEQNRTDRDQFITVNAQNIESQYLKNFEKMPETMMTVSGLEPFDFESIMIYPPNMFSSNRQATMTSKTPNQKIEPLHSLSQIDRKRLDDFYARR